MITWTRTKRVLKNDSEGCSMLLFLSLVMFFFIGVFLVNLYQSSVQSAVYRREGIEMSTWEVFVGAKPAERTINLKDR